MWTRDDTFGDRFSERPLSDFLPGGPPLEWVTENPYQHESRESLGTAIRTTRKWRYHHGLDEIARGGGLYTAYADRVTAMLEMLDRALDAAGVDVPSSSFVDLAAAEGYVSNHVIERGSTDVDSIELSEGNLHRMWQVRAYRGLPAVGRVGRLDLERVDWSRTLGRRYDVVLALGIVYHMENPLLWLRNLYAATERMAVVESDTPSFPANERFRGFGVTYLHRDQVTISAGNVRYITEFRPDRQALAELLLTAGFRRVELVEPGADAASRYFATGEKSMLVAHRD